MKILVTGCRGQLGSELSRLLQAKLPGATTFYDKDSLDITDADAVMHTISQGAYSHIINCAAYTAVDLAEDDGLAACKAVNIDAVRNIAKAAAATGARVLHISTDFVFDGSKNTPYTESDSPKPLSQYGISKLKGETVLLGYVPDAIILRTAWLYSPTGHNFVKTILDKARSGAKLKVVIDQIGTPTYASDLADAILTIISNPTWIAGTYNYTNLGVASWYDLAVAACDIAGIDSTISPCLTADYPTPATRPAYSVLDKSKIKATFNITPPHWMDALKRCIAELKQP